MATILCYTSPARGHLFPTMPILLELRRRGHDVVVYTLLEELPNVRAAGLRARAIDGHIEAIQHDDYEASSVVGALDRAVQTFVARAEHEVLDLREAIRTEKPDALIVDFNCWGAAAVAEASSVPWALFMPYFLPWRLPGLPPFGPGLAPRSDLLGRVRDSVAASVVHRLVNRNLPKLNAVRERVGLPKLGHMTEQGRTAPRVLYYTAEPFEYPCAARPKSVIMLGPSVWEPSAPEPAWLSSIDRPIVLVTCSTEAQGDGAIIEAALEGLAEESVFVVATSASAQRSAHSVPSNARVERFVPHGPLLGRAACVVCHGGMGITQKALSRGVPVCVIPFGRDQHEVARHVEVAGAGVSLDPKRLSPERLRAAVREARKRKEGAALVAEGFARAGGAPRAATEVEALMQASRRSPGDRTALQSRAPFGGAQS
ncbi:Zeaxanthin glucosyl transferase [Labilithrix luteola]|uniref:Zeaxanthin glucosyl transferase n=1 Tax=Labilithrix luteola TaxID=1391654 RepID=A0A0K1PVT4_9BACT|nr:nucleotide disphospho-sugar-binding domain-containing protein [Labilithrix luteola]AKU97645.1 Zeaxanthin glucosyl transferase [Labilithrix luteola]